MSFLIWLQVLFSLLKQVERSYLLFEHLIYMADCSGMLKPIWKETVIIAITFATTFESCEKDI